MSPVLLGKRRLRKISVVTKTIQIFGAYNLFSRENWGGWRRNGIEWLQVVHEFLIKNVESSTYPGFLHRLPWFVWRSKQVLWLLAKPTLDSTSFFVLRNTWSRLMTLNILQLSQGSPSTPRAACWPPQRFSSSTTFRINAASWVWVWLGTHDERRTDWRKLTVAPERASHEMVSFIKYEDPNYKWCTHPLNACFKRCP